jgi:hypothetical protein
MMSFMAVLTRAQQPFLASISVMDADRCFEPSQIVCLSLNAKVHLHDLVLPMTMSLDKLMKAGHTHGFQWSATI